MPEFSCEKHPGAICGCNLSVGELQLRRGLLVRTDSDGNVYLRAPRRADVHLAQRVVAAVAGASDDTSKYLVDNLRGLRKA